RAQARFCDGNIKWKFGIISGTKGQLHYEILVGEQKILRHVDQLRPTRHAEQKGSITSTAHRIIPTTIQTSEDEVGEHSDNNGFSTTGSDRIISEENPNPESILEDSLVSSPNETSGSNPNIIDVEPTGTTEESTSSIRRSTRLRKPVDRLKL
uniref:Uncharacterized protein K02A2.6-like n=1 Tax=Diabrotica virgifera virgifera TaxID=50390 RepID=A0A6P7GYB9_DIAVI